MNKRYKFLYYFLIIFIIVNLATRISLLAYSFESVDKSFFELLKTFAVGFFYDLVAYFYYIIPFVVYLFLVPQKIFNSKVHKFISLAIFFGVIYGVVFNAFSEWFFWNEFGKRFNFIAVDYLVYTHEVIHNILESYPIPLLMTIIFLITAVIFGIIYKKTDGFKEIFEDKSSYKSRFLPTAVLLAIPVLSFNFLNKQPLAVAASKNIYNQELAKDGWYSLFSAFRNNELDYNEFYITKDINAVLKNYRKLVKGKNAKFQSSDLNNTWRYIDNGKNEKHYNVILVMIESMSAEYMGIFGDKHHLTPHLDTLAKESLFFDHFFATGTRTVRGMEAVTMSVPPTPGRSIVKRPDNHNMFGMGWIFKERGYDNKFIYAGHGYFDNMNDYFGHNGFKIVDRLDFDDSEVTFSNVWGVCDEDLFNKTLKEADKSYKSGKHFFSYVMTTSNHRPYTYPDGKIDIPSHTGRYGGVKYTDYAINEFLNNARKKPWFKDTIFIFLADHNGGSAGKTSLPLWRYKIPLIVYAPAIIKPQTVSKISSQIDLAPTLFALMGWSYKSKFYGRNILADDFKERALIGNYQKLGLYKDGKLTILTPNKKSAEFKVEELKLRSNRYKEIPQDKKDLFDTVTYYQSASYFYKNRLDRIK